MKIELQDVDYTDPIRVRDKEIAALKATIAACHNCERMREAIEAVLRFADSFGNRGASVVRISATYIGLLRSALAQSEGTTRAERVKAEIGKAIDESNEEIAELDRLNAQSEDQAGGGS